MKNLLRGGHGIDLETLARRVAPTISAPRNETAHPAAAPAPPPEPTPVASEIPRGTLPPAPMGEFRLNFDNLAPDPTPPEAGAIRQPAAPEPVRQPDPDPPVELEPPVEPEPDPEPERDPDPEPAPYWSPPLIRSSGETDSDPTVEPKEKKATVYPSPQPTPYDHDQPGASRIPPDQRRPSYLHPETPQPRPEGRKVSDLDRVFAMLQQALNASTAVDQTAHSLKARLYGENGEFHGPDEQFDHGPMIPRLLAIAEILRDQSLRAHAHLIDISRVA